MHFLQVLVAMLGRVCLSLIFILSAVGKILNWQATKQLFINALDGWVLLGKNYFGSDHLVESILPHAPQVLMLGTGFELIGGLLILLGIIPRLGASLLLIFLIPTTLLFHHFWLLDGADRELQMVMFLKNLAIYGGLLLVLAFGLGPKFSSSSKPPKKGKAADNE